METPVGFYKCPNCGRSYKSASTPDKCAVCGADGGVAQPEKPAQPLSDKFMLAVSRAKGNF